MLATTQPQNGVGLVPPVAGLHLAGGGVIPGWGQGYTWPGAELYLAGVKKRKLLSHH